MRILVLYLSHDGQTKSIAMSIAGVLVESMECDVQALQNALEPRLEEYQGIVIGASVRYGHFPAVLLQFTQQHVVQLNAMPSALFTVNLTARKAEKCSPQTNGYTRKFLLATPWKPSLCAVFAGALHYPRYGWFDKLMIKLIMKLTGGETDTTKEVEYTNWQAVTRFAQDFAQYMNNNTH